jgi:predicted peptidase
MLHEVNKSETYNYLLHLPKNYHTAEKWPAILYLHGIGGKGDYLAVLKAHGLPKLLEQKVDLPFIVISPQCPEGEEWSPALLSRLLDDISAQYEVDMDRVYLTGIGEGASAAWDLAAKEPEKFAAVAPICGRGNPHEVCKLRDLPVWTFHGARDRITPISETQSMVLALKLCGGNVSFTIYPDEGHDSWTAAYSDPRFYEWLLQQTRANFAEPVLDAVAEGLD